MISRLIHDTLSPLFFMTKLFMNGRHTWFKGMEQVHMEDCHVTTSTCHPPMPSLNAHDYCYSSSNLLYMYTCSWIHMCTAACAFILVWHLDDKNCCLFWNGSGRNYLSWDWNTFKCALCAVRCKAAQLIFLGASHQLYLSLSTRFVYRKAIGHSMSRVAAVIPYTESKNYKMTQCLIYRWSEYY